MRGEGVLPVEAPEQLHNHVATNHPQETIEKLGTHCQVTQCTQNLTKDSA